MKCPECGAQCVPTEKQCRQCHTPLPQSPPERATSQSSKAASRGATRRFNRQVLMPAVIILALILLGAGGAWYWYNHTRALACARAFCAAIDNRDAQAFQALLSSEDRQLVGPAVEVGVRLGRFNGAATNSKVESVSVHDDRAEANIRITERGNSGSFTTMPLAMVKEAGGWRVDTFLPVRRQMMPKELEARGIPPNALKPRRNLRPPVPVGRQ